MKRKMNRVNIRCPVNVGDNNSKNIYESLRKELNFLQNKQRINTHVPRFNIREYIQSTANDDQDLANMSRHRRHKSNLRKESKPKSSQNSNYYLLKDKSSKPKENSLFQNINKCRLDSPFKEVRKMERSIYSNSFTDEFGKNRTKTASFNKSANLNIRRFANNNIIDESLRPINTPSMNQVNNFLHKRKRNKSSASRMCNTENINLSHQGFLK